MAENFHVGLFQSSGAFITSEERSLAFWLSEHGFVLRSTSLVKRHDLITMKVATRYFLGTLVEFFRWAIGPSAEMIRGFGVCR